MRAEWEALPADHHFDAAAPSGYRNPSRGRAVLRRKRAARVNIGIEADPAVADLWGRMEPPACDIVESDAAAFLKEFPFSGRELVYSDPPSIWECGFPNAEVDRKRALGLLSGRGARLLVSDRNVWEVPGRARGFVVSGAGRKR